MSAYRRAMLMYALATGLAGMPEGMRQRSLLEPERKARTWHLPHQGKKEIARRLRRMQK